MPDIDDLSSFSDGFSEGMNVNQLPASEVRRRGDRMRRRNTTLATVGGVVAAAVFIGTPVALMSGGDDDNVQPAPPAPTPTVTEDAEPAWITAIPADFPVTEGMTDEGEPDEGDTDAFNLCDTSYPTSRGTADTQTWTYSGDGESSVQRTFQLWPDADAADASLDALVQGVQDCPQQPTPGGEDFIESKLIEFDNLGDRTVTFTQQVVADDGLISQLTTVEATRVGNAVLVDSTYGSVGGDEAITRAIVKLAGQSGPTRAAMSVFVGPSNTTNDPAPDTETSDAPPVEGGTAGIPSDFPLDQGIEPSGDGEFEYGLDVDAFGQVQACGTADWAPEDTVERLAVLSTGVEYREARELATFTSAGDAVDAVQAIRDAVTACPQEDNQINDVLAADTGYDSFTWGFSYDEGLGGGVFQISRVGSAVLVLYEAGETSRPGLQGTADSLTTVTKDLARWMCRWTEAGC